MMPGGSVIGCPKISTLDLLNKQEKENRKIYTNLITLIILIFALNSCKGGKLPGADARKVSADPRERVQKNIEEGRGLG